jgi:uncharacterized membrane protein
MKAASTKKAAKNIFLRLHPVHRLVISLLLAIVTFIIIANTTLSVLIKVMMAWTIFALFHTIASWIVFFTREPSEIREHAKQEDGSRIYVFLLILITSFASLVAVLLLMLSKSQKDTPQVIYISVAVSGMLLSWIMVHTLFGFHYANLYYANNKKDPSIHAEGLKFPEEKKPDYLDFAYFSFVLGMTFQVSDVDVTSKTIRRMALLHGLISFVLNTFVVALTINIIAGLMG